MAVKKRVHKIFIQDCIHFLLSTRDGGTEVSCCRLFFFVLLCGRDALSELILLVSVNSRNSKLLRGFSGWMGTDEETENWPLQTELSSAVGAARSSLGLWPPSISGFLLPSERALSTDPWFEQVFYVEGDLFHWLHITLGFRGVTINDIIEKSIKD